MKPAFPVTSTFRAVSRVANGSFYANEATTVTNLARHANALLHCHVPANLGYTVGGAMSASRT